LRLKAYLCIAAQRVDDIQPLARHGGIEPALQVAELLVARAKVALPDQYLLDAIGQVLVGRLATPQLGEVVGLLLLLVVLVDLGLRHGHRVVRAGAGGHHGACV
jgi:ABC-type phosphonate transport system ATPase subunit